MKIQKKIKEVVKYYERKNDGRFYPVSYGEKGWDVDLPYKMVVRYGSDQNKSSVTCYAYNGDTYGRGTSLYDSSTYVKETPAERIFYDDFNSMCEASPNGKQWRFKNSYVYDEYGDPILDTHYKDTCDDVDEINYIYYTHYTRDERGHVLVKLLGCSYSEDIYLIPIDKRKYRSYILYFYNEYGDLIRKESGDFDSDGNYLPSSTKDLHRIWYELPSD